MAGFRTGKPLRNLCKEHYQTAHTYSHLSDNNEYIL